MGFHIAVTDLREGGSLEELARLPEQGITSYKLFMAYKGALMVDDETLFRTMEVAADTGALVMVHAENGDAIDVLVKQALAAGNTAPHFHALTRPPELEGEATNRAIQLARIAGAPLYVVHVSCKEAVDPIARAREQGWDVWGETCTQYFFIDYTYLERPDFEGAKYVYTPPPRNRENQEILWHAVRSDILSAISTDHCAFLWDGQKSLGRDDFSKIPNGGPGLENRLHMIHEHGVRAGRISLNRMVELLATNPAKLFGLYPRKGTIAPGSDADIVVFDPERRHLITAATQHSKVDYNLYEGTEVTGSPETVLLRGNVLVDGGELVAEPGVGRVRRAGGLRAGAPARSRSVDDQKHGAARRAPSPLSGAPSVRVSRGRYDPAMAIVEANPNLGAQIVEDAKEYVLYSWSTQDAINPIAVAGAEGRYFWDYDGKRYLDFASQLVNVNIGHQHPKIIAAIKEQADKLCTIGPPMASESRSRLGRLLEEVTPGDLCMSFFTNSGAEANENAIKLARLATGRHKIIARYRSYHGATHGSIVLTGDPRRWPNEPGMGGVVRMLDPYTYRCPAGHPDPCPVCSGAPHLEEILEYEGAHTVAAVILETVTGTNGIIPPPPGYLQAIREVCDRHGILLILDEVMCGFGRTGRWFACENWDVVPDIITVAKGINSGYVPLGAMIIREHLKEWVRSRYFPGGLTYAGHPLACASAVASIEAFQEEGVVENAAEVGAYLGDGLRALAARHPSIGEVRGLGCFWGIELVKNRETREMLVPFNASGDAAAPVARLARASLERGLYLMTHWNVVMVVPPLTVTREEVDEGLAVLDETLAIADEFAAA